VEEVPILGRGDERQIFNEFFSHYDAPAYVRRARRVQEAFDALLARCRRQREEWLGLARSRLGLLRGLAGQWGVLHPWLANDGVDVLRRLETELNPQLRVPVEPTTSKRVLQRALQELIESLERFNRRWQEFLPTVDLTEVNELREQYNRYYLLEKECALRSPRLARQGFQRLSPVTTASLAELLPPLPMPQWKAATR
jgi:hypothetical protein